MTQLRQKEVGGSSVLRVLSSGYLQYPSHLPLNRNTTKKTNRDNNQWKRNSNKDTAAEPISKNKPKVHIDYESSTFTYSSSSHGDSSQLEQLSYATTKPAVYRLYPTSIGSKASKIRAITSFCNNMKNTQNNNVPANFKVQKQSCRTTK